MAYAELMGITIAPTVRSAIAKLMMNMLETWKQTKKNKYNYAKLLILSFITVQVTEKMLVDT